jgi:quercetin dioxygenase-like cupin family protein
MILGKTRVDAMVLTFAAVLSPRRVTIVTKFFCITAIRMIAFITKHTNTETIMTDITRTKTLGAHENAFGPLVMFVTKVSEADDYCVAHSIFPTGVFVPVHSHEDRETFYVISGKLEYWNGREWTTLTAGDVADVPRNHVHAWTNVSGDDATSLFVTTSKMGRFFKDIMAKNATMPKGSPGPEALQELGMIATRYGYRMGTPEESAAAGLTN